MEEKKVVEFLVKYRDLCNEYGFIIEGLWDDEACVAPQMFSFLTYNFLAPPYTVTELYWGENEDDVPSCYKLVPEKIED